jgi:hypothetical protein
VLNPVCSAAPNLRRALARRDIGFDWVGRNDTTNFRQMKGLIWAYGTLTDDDRVITEPICAVSAFNLAVIGLNMVPIPVPTGARRSDFYDPDAG